MEVGGMLWSNWRKLAKGNEMEKIKIKKSFAHEICTESKNYNKKCIFFVLNKIKNVYFFCTK